MHRLLMENKREIRGPKLKSYDGVLSPINSINVAGNRRYRSVLDPYASDSSDSPSPLMKFLRSVDPATSGSSSPVFVTPVKVEEDVIVMDGISVPKSNKGSGEVRMRLPFSANSVNCSFGKSNLSSSSSSGSGGRRIGAENIKSFKNRLCHFWETSGICQFGFECQFAHGKEELRHNRYAGKIKHEPLNRISKLNSNFEGSIPSPYGSKFSRNSQFKTAAAAARTEEAFSLPSLPTEMAIPASPIPAKTIISRGGKIPDSTLPISDWTPQMDGIEVSLPSDFTLENSSSKDDVNAYIEKVLYGKKTNARKRLPVFVDICPDC